MGRVVWKVKEEQGLTLYPESCEKNSYHMRSFWGKHPDFGEAEAVKKNAGL